MRNTWISRLRAAAIGAVVGLLMLYPQDAMEAARNACRLWATGVMPALFPYMVFSQLLASGCAGSGGPLVPLSMLGGSPSGAKLIELAGLSPERAQRLAALCATASPLFILGTLSGGMRMLLAHWLGALVAWAFVRLLTHRHKEEPLPTGRKTVEAVRLGLPEAVRDAALAMLSVCGCMAVFSVLSALLDRLLPLPGALSTFLACVLEMAGGCAKIQALGLPEAIAAPLLCATVSFGGLSVFMQNAAFLKPAGVNLCTQFLARVVHALAAGAACFLFFYLGGH